MTTTFQAPKGTRDFYPDAMAVRRYIEDTWRKVSERHGFVEVDGPTFESLDLYKVKSGDEIVSQLFHFTDRGEREFALRPEFTPTLARMVAEKANALPRPIKWFSIPRCYRAEAPQKGRLREFIQWNVDMLGDASLAADVECLTLCIDLLRELGFTDQEVRIGWNHREWMTKALTSTVVPEARVPEAYFILDKLHKLNPDERQKLYAEKQCSQAEKDAFEVMYRCGSGGPAGEAALQELLATWPAEIRQNLADFQEKLGHSGVGPFAGFDVTVVRGLAYYTGFVFEVFDKTATNRAVAGGGRYDKLIELFGGPSVPAVGFGMGDVVLEILLREKGKLPASLLPRPAVFVVNALPDGIAAQQLLAELRTSQWNAEHTAILRPGLHAVGSYKATKNVGKLLQDASTSGARFAILLAPQEHARGVCKLKDLAARTEREVPLAEVIQTVLTALKTG